MSFNDVSKTYQCSLQIPSCMYKTKNMKEFAEHYRTNHRASHGMLKFELFSQVIENTSLNVPQAAPKHLEYHFNRLKIQDCQCNLQTESGTAKPFAHFVRAHRYSEGLRAKFFYCINHNEVSLACEDGPIEKHIKSSRETLEALREGVFTYNGKSWILTPGARETHISEILYAKTNNTESSQHSQRNRIPIEMQPMPILPTATPINSGYQLSRRRRVLCECDLPNQERLWHTVKHILRTHQFPEGISVRLYYCSIHREIPLAYQQGPIREHVGSSKEDCSVERGTFYYNGTYWDLTEQEATDFNEIIEMMRNKKELVPSKKRNGSSMEDSPKKIRIREDLHDAEADTALVHDLFPQALLPDIPTDLFEVPLPEPIFLPKQ